MCYCLLRSVIDEKINFDDTRVKVFHLRINNSLTLSWSNKQEVLCSRISSEIFS